MQSGLMRVPAALEGTGRGKHRGFFSRCYMVETIEFPNHLITKGPLSRRVD